MSCKHANNSDLNVEMRITLPCIDTLCKRSLVTSVCDQKLRKIPGLLRRIYYVTWGAKTQTRGRTFSLWTLMLMLRGGAVESAVRHGSARSRDTFSHSEKGTRRYANAQRHQEPLHWSITCPKRKKNTPECCTPAGHALFIDTQTILGMRLMRWKICPLWRWLVGLWLH